MTAHHTPHAPDCGCSPRHLHHDIAVLVTALRAIEEAADEAQGEWVGIEVPYAPAWTMPLKDIADQARAALEAAGEPVAAPETPEQDVERRR